MTFLAINRLGEREILAMIEGVIGDKALPANIRQDIIERTDGIPLFVEEMTKAVLEAESQGAIEHLTSAVRSSTLAVPASLQASLMARLDRLGPAKEVAQIGAAIGREFSHSLLAAVVRKPEADLGAALDRLIQSGLVFRQSVPPHATYLFKHALVQDAAYGTLLREPRRALHARIAATLERQFADIAESQPELQARHCTEAGLIEKAAHLWGKAAQRSVERSALVEAIAQFTRALDQMETLPATLALRREQIKLQVALITPLIRVKGYAAPETKAAVERARLLIEQAEALGEPLDDPLLLFSVLYGLWVVKLVATDGGAMRQLAMQFLELAEKHGSTAPLMMGHRLMGASLMLMGDIVQSRTHLDEAIALYNPAADRPLAAVFGNDPGITSLGFRARSLWLLGYPGAALADAEHALRDAREIGQAATLMLALFHASLIHVLCGDYTVANKETDELVAVADEKTAAQWKAQAMLNRGCVLIVTGRPADAVQMIDSGVAAYRSTGSTMWLPLHLSYLVERFQSSNHMGCPKRPHSVDGKPKVQLSGFLESVVRVACAELHRFDEAWRCIGEAVTAVETTKEKWSEAEIHRMTGEIALKSPEPDKAKAEAYFERALAVAPGKILGTARGDEHDAALARSGSGTSTKLHRQFHAYLSAAEGVLGG